MEAYLYYIISVLLTDSDWVCQAYMTTCLTWKVGDLPIFLIWKREPIYSSYEGFPADKNASAWKIYGD